MHIPFLFELRATMDWLFTDTSFSLGDWFKMEAIFTNLFSVKVSGKRGDKIYKKSHAIRISVHPKFNGEFSE